MKTELMENYTHICTCHNCGAELHYNPYGQNIYNGGPWVCGNCNSNVTQDIYRKSEKSEKNEEIQNKNSDI